MIVFLSIAILIFFFFPTKKTNVAILDTPQSRTVYWVIEKELVDVPKDIKFSFHSFYSYKYLGDEILSENFLQKTDIFILPTDIALKWEREEKINIWGVVDILTSYKIFVPKNSSIKAVEELKNKEIMTLNHSLLNMILLEDLKSHGINESDIVLDIKNYTSYLDALMPTILAEEKVIFSWGPFFPHLYKNGWKDIFDLWEEFEKIYEVKPYILVIATTKNISDENIVEVTSVLRQAGIEGYNNFESAKAEMNLSPLYTIEYVNPKPYEFEKLNETHRKSIDIIGKIMGI